MKRICMLLLVCLILTAACGNPRTTEKNIRLQGKTEAVLYTVRAPVDGEIRGLILDVGERIRKGQPLFGLGTQDENPEVEKAATELAKAQARLNNAAQGNSEASRASAASVLQSARSQVQRAEQNYNKMQRLYKRTWKAPGRVWPPPRPATNRSPAPTHRKNWRQWSSRWKRTGRPTMPLSLPWKAARSSALPPESSGRSGSKTGKP